MASTPSAGVVGEQTAPSVETDEQQNGGAAAQKASEAADQARETVSQAADQAREKAGEAAQEARGRVRDQVDERSTKLGGQVASTASDLRTVGEELRKQGKDTPAKLADQAAERSERVGRYLSQSDADRILGDVEDFARRQPWAVVAGGLALGFAASRFLKASSGERYRARQAGSRGSAPALGGAPVAPPPQATDRTLAPPEPHAADPTVAPPPPAPPQVGAPPAGIASGAPVPGGFTPAS